MVHGIPDLGKDLLVMKEYCMVHLDGSLRKGRYLIAS
jgi:hypothetical protein